MRLLFLYFIVVTIAACTDNSTTTAKHTDSTLVQNAGGNEPASSNENTREKPSVNGNASGCYWKIVKQDTFAIQLAQTGDSVTGKLSFNNYEKDSSSGTVTGTVEGNIIKLWYHFASEGMNSVMQIYFRKEGDQLLRGIGPFDAKGDSSFYTDYDAIRYTQDQAFINLRCEELSRKYK